MNLWEKLKRVKERYEELTQQLARPETYAQRELYQRLAKEQAELQGLVQKLAQYEKLLQDMQEAEALLGSADAELRSLAEVELQELKRQRPRLERELTLMLLPKDVRDEKSVIMEIRAGTGGEEAALFAAELFRMYSRYAEQKGWQVEVLSSHPTGLGGLKEVIISISGRGAFSRLKYESGVHRVQRVPVTEASGRLHTSAATVAVLPEAEELDLKIQDKDLRIDTFCASGPGGQGVNTTYSAVRVVHLPTGLVVQCQDERSQLKNKEKALRVLRSRLYEMELQRQAQERAEVRKAQVGTGDRSQRIRTYNFPQNRVTDHRVGLTLYKLQEVLQGHLDELIEALIAHFQAERLKEVESA
jgi:peptide chain release factor 1